MLIDAGQGQPADQRADRVFRQVVKFLFLLVLHGAVAAFLRIAQSLTKL
jgi:hypothetical protein